MNVDPCGVLIVWLNGKHILLICLIKIKINLRFRFQSRQSQNDTTNWLSSKCTCPLCRQTFCILDVCPLQNSELTKID